MKFLLRAFSFGISIILNFNLAFSKDVQLKWKPIDGANGYLLEVAKDDDFSELVIKQKVTENHLSHEMKAGIYYLRVQAINAYDLPGVWSKPFKLVVTTPVVAPAAVNQHEKEVALKFSERKPTKVKAKWNPPEPSEKYQVIVKKNGKEIDRFETSESEAQVSPTEEGEYEIAVSSSVGDEFGPPTTVKKFKLEKVQPQEKGQFKSKGHVSLNLQPEVGAKFYEISIYKDEGQGQDRSPANAEAKPFIKIKSRSPKLFLGRLPPGRYVASVTPVTGDSENAPATVDYNFDVQKAKPVEFDHVDLSFRYAMRSVNYEAYVSEAGSQVSTSSIGGDIGFEGNLWFPNSKWGVKASGSFGNLLINSKVLTNSELLLSGQYMFKSNLKAGLGARVWQLPIMLYDGPSGQNNPLFYKNFSPTFVGPAIHGEYTYVLNKNWAAISALMISAPLAHSNFTGSETQKPMNFTPNARLDLGAKYALGGNMRLFATAGFDHQEFSHNTNQGRNGSVTSDSQTRVSMESALVSLGAELTDDGAYFNNDRQIIREKFSDIDLTARYSLTPLTYYGHVLEIGNINNNNTFGSEHSFNSPSSGELQLDTLGYFLGSKHGFKFTVDWGGYSYQGTTVSYPEFQGQWAYRNSTQKTTWGWENYLGFRSWQVPLVVPFNTSSGATSYLSENPQLVGIVNGLKGKYSLNPKWKLSLLGEVSTPFMVSNQSANVGSMRYFSFSYKVNMDVSYSVTPDLNAGLGLGYKADRFDYIPANFNDTYSTLKMSAPLISIFGVYGF